MSTISFSDQKSSLSFIGLKTIVGDLDLSLSLSLSHLLMNA